ncbi:MAG: tetratricopeptide repeat protein [Bacteroidales bacterium]
MTDMHMNTTLTIEDIENNHAMIRDSVMSQHLKMALQDLYNFALESKHSEALSAAEEMDTTYTYMLRYMADGYADEERERHYQHIIQAILQWNDIVADKLLSASSRNYFYVRRRYLMDNFHRLTGLDFSEFYKYTIASIASHRKQIEVLEQQENRDSGQNNALISIKQICEEEVSQLFEAIWTSVHSKTEKDFYDQIFSEDYLPAESRALLISAITLSFFSFYNDDKARVIIKLCRVKNPLIRSRALVSLLILLNQHQGVLKFFPSTDNAVRLLLEEEPLQKELQDIILDFYRTRETDAINRKMTEEILPEMLKMAKSSNSGQINKSEDEFDEHNPEWDMMSKSGISKKLEELSALQLEGADVFLSTFSGLKTYPFFYSIANWFLPFSSSHSIIDRIFPNDKTMGTGVLSIMLRSTSLCNSDKFSFSLSIEQMPASQRNILAEQFSGAASELSQDELKETLMKHAHEPQTIARHYIQDLYRFFTLHNQRASFRTIFDKPLIFFKNSYLHAVTHTEEMMNRIVAYHFKKNFYAEASTVLQDYLTIYKPNGEIYQQIGYCQEQFGNLDEALKAYLKAEFFTPESVWNLRRIASIYEKREQYERAAEYYRRALEIKPDNINLTAHYAQCLYELKNYDESLKHYFKIDYIKDGDPRAWRGIFWNSLMSGKYEQAEKYQFKVLEAKEVVQPYDYLNLGHLYLSQKRMKEAVQAYVRFMKSDSFDFSQEDSYEHFADLIDNEKPLLADMGIPSEIIDKLSDIVFTIWQEESKK